MSPVGSGDTTFSVLERSMPRPITDVSPEESVNGSPACMVSSLISVVAKSPVVCLAASSSANGTSDFEMSPTSVDAVEDTMRRSFKCGL